MRASTLILVLLPLLSVPVIAQDFEWAGRIGSDLLSNVSATELLDDPVPGSVDTAEAMAVSPGGEIYIVGSFERETDFDLGPGEFYMDAVDSSDTYVLKLDADGGFVWALQFGGTAFEKAFAIAADTDGGLFVTGFFSGAMDFDPGPDSFELESVENSGYVLKLGADGSFVWVRVFETTDSSSVLAITTDPAGTIHVAGVLRGTADFDPGPDELELTSTGSEDAYVVKLDADGTLIWAVHQGGPDNESARKVAVDATGAVYTVGSFNATLDFDPGPGVFELTSMGQYDVYLSKLDADGNFVWARSFGGWQLDGPEDLRLHDDGTIHVTGLFRTTVDFDPGPGVVELTSLGYFDGFVTQFDSDGELIWARQVGGTGPDTAWALNVDDLGNVYTVGIYTPPVDFDPGPGEFVLDGNSVFAFAYVWKLDGNGDFVWARSLDGTTHVEPTDVGIDALGNVFTAGNFNGPADFDPGPDVFELPSEFVDAFVLKLSPPGASDPGGVPDGGATPGAPLRLDRAGGGTVILQWEAACNATDYAVVSGELSVLSGAGYHHAPALCSTGGQTEATLDLPGGSLYLLVLPHDAEVEGSYGHDSSGNERPPASSPCHPQSIGTCS